MRAEIGAPALRGLAQDGGPNWFDRVMGYGTDVYAKYAELQAAIASGASAAQIAMMQQQLIQAQQNAEYQKTLETRKFMLTAGAGAFALIGFLAWNSTRTKGRRR